MRCQECGWPNVSGSQSCSKCGASLLSTAEYRQIDEDGLKKTVNESDVFSDVPQNSKKCSKCGYPLRQNSDKCPNCNYQISGTPISQISGRPAPIVRRPTRLDISGDGAFSGTVNPYMVNVEMPPVCTLKPVKRANERHDPQEQEYEGKSILLTRNNTEPNNLSITSKEQAVLSCVDGQWFIEDKSDQHTTFVQASSPTPLKDGDLVLLGNRLFEFHE